MFIISQTKLITWPNGELYSNRKCQANGVALQLAHRFRSCIDPYVYIYTTAPSFDDFVKAASFCSQINEQIKSKSFIFKNIDGNQRSLGILIPSLLCRIFISEKTPDQIPKPIQGGVQLQFKTPSSITFQYIFRCLACIIMFSMIMI